MAHVVLVVADSAWQPLMRMDSHGFVLTPCMLGSLRRTTG
jgi:hypothetical protein